MPPLENPKPCRRTLHLAFSFRRSAPARRWSARGLRQGLALQRSGGVAAGGRPLGDEATKRRLVHAPRAAHL
jgi:hypothetical protein